MKNIFILIVIIAFFAVIVFPAAANGEADRSSGSTASSTDNRSAVSGVSSTIDRRAELKGLWVMGGYTTFDLYYDVLEDGTVVAQLGLHSGGDLVDLLSYDGTTAVLSYYTGGIMTFTAIITGNTLVINGLTDDENHTMFYNRFNGTYRKREPDPPVYPVTGER